MSEIDWAAWHDDGHKLSLKLGMWTQRDGRNFGTIKVDVECPPDSVCNQHHRERGYAGDPYCSVRGDIEAIGVHDFLDGALETTGLPDDWSSPVQGLEIEWRDQGEDGILWRPKGAAAEQREAA